MLDTRGLKSTQTQMTHSVDTVKTYGDKRLGSGDQDECPHDACSDSRKVYIKRSSHPAKSIDVVKSLAHNSGQAACSAQGMAHENSDGKEATTFQTLLAKTWEGQVALSPKADTQMATPFTCILNCHFEFAFPMMPDRKVSMMGQLAFPKPRQLKSNRSNLHQNLAKAVKPVISDARPPSGKMKRKHQHSERVSLRSRKVERISKRLNELQERIDNVCLPLQGAEER